jgi:alcohol dehydrogenase (cytochrome c)
MRAALLVLLLLQAPGLAQTKVTPGESSQWLSYSGDDTGRRHSALTQITTANAGELRPVWTFQTGVLGKWEASPLVIDGVIYATGPENTAWAIEAGTGRMLWRYRRVLQLGELSICCGPVNRGFAVYKNKLLMLTLDAHLLALDITTGKPVYDVVVADSRQGYTGTAAPLVVKDKVIVGIAGAEFGIRGFIDAFDAETGTRAWRFWTVPLPGEPGGDTWLKDSAQHGGGPTWVTGSYDPQLNLVYWGTGNPSPLYFGAGRAGDNLFTNCLLALDPDSGKLVWWYQFTPHDTHDWDSNHVPVLADLEFGGAPRKVVMVANRNGFFYVLDRTNGKFLLGKPFARQTWAREIGADGRPVVLPNSEPTAEGTMTCPDFFGATNFMSPSFNPALRLFFVTARDTCGSYYTREQEFVAGQRYEAGGMRRGGADPGIGALRAIDVATGERRWEVRTARPSLAGTASTASGLVFSGDMDGNFFVVDASTGQKLWTYQTGSAIYASPITYLVDGKQYVLLGSGTTLTAYALR